MNSTELKELLEAAGVSQRQLGREIGWDHSSISRYVTDERDIPADFESLAVPFLKRKALARLSTISDTLAGVG